MTTPELPTPELAELLGAAMSVVLAASGHPVAGAVAKEQAPAVLALFHKLFWRHQGGEPIAEILKAPLTDDSALIDAIDREETP